MSFCVFVKYMNSNIYSLNHPTKISEILVLTSVKSSVGLLENAERNSGLIMKGCKLFHSWGCSGITPITSNRPTYKSHSAEKSLVLQVTGWMLVLSLKSWFETSASSTNLSYDLGLKYARNCNYHKNWEF